MWLDWRNRVDIYLARGTAAIRTRALGVRVVNRPQVVPVSDLLSAISEFLPSGGHLTIAVSSRIARPTSVQFPQGLKTPEEANQFALAAVAKKWGQPPETLSVQKDQFGSGIVGVLGCDVESNFRAWAAQHLCTIKSLQPVWSVASRLQSVRRPSVKGFVLAEPDGLSLIAEPGSISGLSVSDACALLAGVNGLNWKEAKEFEKCPASELGKFEVYDFSPSQPPHAIETGFSQAWWPDAWRRL